MKRVLTYKLIGVPIVVWGLQLLYVAVALVLLMVLVHALNRQGSHLPVVIPYVLVMIVLNVVWRLAVERMMPDWF